MSKNEASRETRARRAAVTREAAGRLVVGLADELARPLAEIEELLASVVERFDSHHASAEGPDPMSFEDAKMARELIAGAYLRCTGVSRLAADLASAVRATAAVESVDVNEQVEAAIGLARCRYSRGTELFIDLGTLPPVPTAPGDLVLAVTRLLLFCAESTRDADEAAVSIRTRAVARGGKGAVTIAIAENGRGATDVELAEVTALVRILADRQGGVFNANSEPGSGSTFELRLNS